jgi:hypothetical protein
MDDKKVTEKGAVTLEEGELQQVVGAYSKIEFDYARPAQSPEQLNFTKIEY